MKKFIYTLLVLIFFININFSYAQDQRKGFKRGSPDGLSGTANENITGDWSFTGTVTFTTVTIITLTATTSITVGSDALDKNGVIYFVASDNDQANIVINTSDKLIVSGASALQLLGAGDIYLEIDKPTATSRGYINYRINTALAVLAGMPPSSINGTDGDDYQIAGSLNDETPWFYIESETGYISIGQNTPTGWLTIDGNKGTVNLFELINDDNGTAGGDSGSVFNKYGHLISTSVSPSGIGLNHSFADSIDVAGEVTATGSMAIIGSATNLYLDYGSATADHNIIINFGDDGVNDAHTFSWDDGTSRFLFSDDVLIGAVGLTINTSGQLFDGSPNLDPTISISSTSFSIVTGTGGGDNIQIHTSAYAAGVDGEIRLGDTVTAGEYTVFDSLGSMIIGAGTVTDGIVHTFEIANDFDSDGTATEDRLKISSTAASDPTDGLWTVETTQGAGIDFDMPLIASTLTSDGDLVWDAGQYLITEFSANQVAFRNTTSTTNVNFRFQAQDRDGTDNVSLNYDAIGQPGDANRESFIVGYFSAQTSYQIYTTENGTGVNRNIQIGHNSNPDDLILTLTTTTFNEGGDDIDFRIEASGIDSAHVVNGADGNVYMEGLGSGIGTLLVRVANTDEIVELNGLAVFPGLVDGNGTSGTADNEFADSINVAGVVDATNGFLVNGVAQEIRGHGYMAFADSAQVLTMTQNVWAKITQESDSLYSTYIQDSGTFLFQGDSIRVLTSGHVSIEWDVSFTGANTDVYKGAIFVNNTIKANQGQWRRDITGTDAGNASAAFAYNASANDWISFRVVNTANGNDMTVICGNVRITR